MKVLDWLNESNRWKHLIGGMVLGMLLTVFAAIGAAGGMEFKDKEYGGKWDWIDFGLTVLGGVVGQMIVVVVLLVVKYC